MSDPAREYLSSLAALKLAATREQDAVQLGHPPTDRFKQEVVLAIEARETYTASLDPTRR